MCQIERGYMPGLTFNAVMDFLAACGADASAIKDIFDAYTKRPPILEERTRKQVAEAAVGLPLLKRARVSGTTASTNRRPANARRQSRSTTGACGRLGV